MATPTSQFTPNVRPNTPICPLCKSSAVELVLDEKVEFSCDVMVPRSSQYPKGIKHLVTEMRVPFYACMRCEWCEVKES